MKMHLQLSLAPCGAVWCRALPCGAMLLHAALWFISNIEQYQVHDAKYRYRYGRVCTHLLAFFKVDCLLLIPMFFPPRK